MQQLSGSCSDGKPGRFERDFVVDDEVGSGEFGKVIKVHYKNGIDSEVYAVKRSKRFEGPRHRYASASGFCWNSSDVPPFLPSRLRLREEVEILQHLSQTASRASYERTRHPNVLAYIDSWEEDETLYIQTELCESGNLAQFLWQFGRAFPRLDEGRVWKIIVDLSNVSPAIRFPFQVLIINTSGSPIYPRRWCYSSGPEAVQCLHNR